MNALEAFNEALGVVPVVHLPVAPSQRVLVIGQSALGLAATALRYPTTESLVYVGEGAIPFKDKRARQFTRIEQLPADWKADLIGVAMPVLTDSMVASVRTHHEATTGVVVFAITRASQVRAAKDQIRKSWQVVQPYREHIPSQPEPAWFMLAADHGFKRERPVPGWTKRISDKYLPALFTLAKDEYALAYGGAP